MFPISVLLLSSWKPKKILIIITSLFSIPCYEFHITNSLFITFLHLTGLINSFDTYCLFLPLLSLLQEWCPSVLHARGVQVWRHPSAAGSLLPSVPTQWWEESLLLLPQAPAANGRLRDRCFQSPTLLQGPLEMDSTLLSFFKSFMLVLKVHL